MNTTLVHQSNDFTHCVCLAESVEFESTDQFPDHSLANCCITALPTLHFNNLSVPRILFYLIIYLCTNPTSLSCFPSRSVWLAPSAVIMDIYRTCLIIFSRIQQWCSELPLIEQFIGLSDKR